LQLLIAALLSLSGAIAIAQGSQADNVKDGVAKIFVVVRASNGKLVPNLKPEDLRVLDNGKPAKVLAVEHAQNIPLRLGIVLLSGEGSFAVQKAAAIELLENLRPGIDEAFVLTATRMSGSHAWPTQELSWNPDPKSLISFVRTLHEDQAVPFAKDPIMALLELNPEKPFRRAMLVFRDSEQNDEPGAYRVKEDERELQEIADYQRRNTVVYTASTPGYMQVDCSALPKSPDQFGCRELTRIVSAERLAARTGGSYLSWGRPQSDIASMTKDLQNQIVVSFASEPDQKAHLLKIRSSRKDVRVLSPTAFYPVPAAAN
jgi:hypothetical protein